MENTTSNTHDGDVISKSWSTWRLKLILPRAWIKRSFNKLVARRRAKQQKIIETLSPSDKRYPQRESVRMTFSKTVVCGFSKHCFSVNYTSISARERCFNVSFEKESAVHRNMQLDDRSWSFFIDPLDFLFHYFTTDIIIEVDLKQLNFRDIMKN